MTCWTGWSAPSMDPFHPLLQNILQHLSNKKKKLLEFVFKIFIFLWNKKVRKIIFVIVCSACTGKINKFIRLFEFQCHAMTNQFELLNQQSCACAHVVTRSSRCSHRQSQSPGISFCNKSCISSTACCISFYCGSIWIRWRPAGVVHFALTVRSKFLQ